MGHTMAAAVKVFYANTCAKWIKTPLGALTFINAAMISNQGEVTMMRNALLLLLLRNVYLVIET